MRNVHSQCPREVLQFILDLIKYNDNRLNKVYCALSSSMKCFHLSRGTQMTKALAAMLVSLTKEVN